MLLNLSIKDFVIVDRLDLEFERGFTVLTGETGAGKSILIDALALILGERADAGAVRAGRERAEVIAEFDTRRLPQLEQWLRDNELAGDPGTCLLRRQIDINGRSRGFINGLPATLAQLREAGEVLVDIQGQHAHLSLLKAAAQRELLDAYAGMTEQALAVAQRYREWQAVHRQRLELERNAEGTAREVEQLEWQIREIGELDFREEEWLELQAEHGRLAHAAALLEGAQLGLELISEGETSSLARLNAVVARLQALVDYDPALRDTLDVLESAQVQLQEGAYSLRHYEQRLDLDPDRLAQCEQRIAAIHSASRKYRVAPEELPHLLAEWRARLSALGGGSGAEGLAEREQEAHRVYLEAGKVLSAARADAARDLSAEVTAVMQRLAMQGGRFQIALTPLEEGSAGGLEQVDFLVAGHASVEAKPLAKVASGGELSRISLAIQVVTSKVGRVPTLIFDEVDVGIGGGVAQIVGQMLRGLAGERQVLCITHLPQVAAQGEHHLRVSKRAEADGVVSRIETLDGEQRVEEIARMLGGVEITGATRAHAAEMLGLS